MDVGHSSVRSTHPFVPMSSWRRDYHGLERFSRIEDLLLSIGWLIDWSDGMQRVEGPKGLPCKLEERGRSPSVDVNRKHV